MATTDHIKERIEVFARELREELGEIDDSDALSLLDAVETQAVEIGDAIHAELVQQWSANRPRAEKDITDFWFDISDVPFSLSMLRIYVELIISLIMTVFSSDGWT